MECTGVLKDVALDWKTGKWNITFTCNENALGEQIEAIQGVEKLAIKAVKHRAKRSLDANAYYWQLIAKVADILHISSARAHNTMLRKYGQIEVIDGQAIYLVLPDTDEASSFADEADTYHIRPTSQVKAGADGKSYRTYMMLRGSSDYDSKEMSTLINGLVDEAKELGIETMTPDEIARMVELWGKNERSDDLLTK